MAAEKHVETQALSIYARKIPLTDKDRERGFAVVDIYRIQRLYGMTDPALNHGMKKIMAPGLRKGGKSRRQDIEEAIYSLQRFLELEDEAAAAGGG